jgi:hypothetical protein
MKMFLTFLLVFAMTFSIGNVAIDKAKADDLQLGDCPSCFAYMCGDEGEDRCITACLEDPEDAYHFWVQWYKFAGTKDGMWYWELEPRWINVLMVEGISYCQSPCHEYTARVNRDIQLLSHPRDFFSGLWAIWDGDDFDPENILNGSVCWNHEFFELLPPYPQTPTPTP